MKNYAELAKKEGFEIVETSEGYKWAAIWHADESALVFETLEELWQDLIANYPAVEEVEL